MLDLLKKTGFFLITTAIVLKNSKNAYLAKINFVIHWLIVQLMITTMNIFFDIWKAFKMNTMKNYHYLDLKVGILFLACVFETFRKESINSF